MSDMAADADAKAAASGGVLAAAAGASKAVLAKQRPWSELLRASAFSLPKGYLDTMGRLRKNGTYFIVNYLLVLLLIMVAIIAFRPTSLGMLTALAALWVYLLVVKPEERQVGRYTLSVKQQGLVLAVFSFLVVFYFTNVGAMLGSGLGCGVAVLCVHASLRTPEADLVAAAEAEAGGTVFKGLTDFVESSVSKETLQNISLDSLRTTFKLPDNAFTRRLERGVDGLVAKVEGGLPF